MELWVFSLFFTRKLVVYSYIFFSFSLEWIVFFFLSFIVERKKHSSYKIHPPNGLYYINDCDKSPNHPPPLAPPLSPLRLLKSHIPIIGEKNHFWNFCNRKRIIAKTFFLSQPSALSRFFRKEVKVHLKWRCLGQSENKCCRMRALSIWSYINRFHLSTGIELIIQFDLYTKIIVCRYIKVSLRSWALARHLVRRRGGRSFFLRFQLLVSGFLHASSKKTFIGNYF